MPEWLAVSGKDKDSNVIMERDIAMPSSLRRQINHTLRRQGYDVSNGVFSLTRTDRETLRQTHALAKKERIARQTAFLHDHTAFIHERMIDGKDLSIEKILPKLIPVTAMSHWETIFRWWNYVWWSMPYESAYGRQMRYVVWDQYHQAVIGLIGLHSPILSWAPRDRYLGLTVADRAYWVNQSMSAQRVGAIPPYNVILGGKLVAMLMTSDTLRKDFRRKYSKKSTVLQKRELPANLLFLTATGAFGKSSLYTRLKFGEEWLASFIGYSHGSGTFHVPDAIYEQLLGALSRSGVNVKRGYGHGPSRKMRLIRQGMEALGYPNGIFHGVKRAVYLFPLARNVERLITGKDRRPVWHHRLERDLTDFWKTRWIVPRINERGKRLRLFSRKHFLDEQLKEIDLL